ncbi:MAG TPA: serine protease [Acidimicrobiaceae bacterium]|nr:serine protease [Acidimicrobiaceae bacterium]
MRSRVLPLLLSSVTAVAVAVPLALSGPSQAGAASLPTQPPANTVQPGIQLLVPQPGSSGSFAECTANFVYSNGVNTYIGMAAHCASTGSSTQTDCTTPVLPDGTPVYIGEGPVYLDPSGTLSVGEDTQGPEVGKMVYNSWVTMQGLGINTSDPSGNQCQFNDLALVQVLPGWTVNPTVPIWGGPDGVATTSPAQGSTVYSYQNSALRLGVSALSPKIGLSLGDTPGSGGWSHIVDTVTPGVPGDSGSGFMDSSGNAFGVLSTLNAGTPPSAYGVDNAAGDVAMELAFCSAHGGLGTVSLVPGTTKFSGLPGGL